MSSYAAADKQKTFGPFVVLALAALLLGIGIGAMMAPRESAGLKASDATKSTSTAKAGLDAITNAPETSQGAAIAATAFVRSIPQMVSMSTSDLGDSISKLAYPMSDATFATDAESTIMASKRSVSSLSQFKVVPVSYKVNVEGENLNVSVYTVAVFADTGNNKAAAIWSTHDIAMKWNLGQWRFQSWKVADGPYPPSGSKNSIDPETLKNFLANQQEYGYAP